MNQGSHICRDIHAVKMSPPIRADRSEEEEGRVAVGDTCFQYGAWVVKSDNHVQQPGSFFFECKLLGIIQRGPVVSVLKFILEISELTL